MEDDGIFWTEPGPQLQVGLKSSLQCEVTHCPRTAQRECPEPWSGSVTRVLARALPWCIIKTNLQGPRQVKGKQRGLGLMRVKTLASLLDGCV